MSPSNRRRFLQQAAVGASAVALTPGLMAANRHRTVPHREQRVPGVHAYALSESVAAGGTLEFCVSADRPYDFAIIQLGEDPDSTNKDKILHQFARQPHRVQPIHPGSCVTLERGMDRAPEEFTVECWLRPFAFGRWQDVVCQMNYPVNCDFALAISPEGHVAFYLGDGGKFDNRWPLNAGAAGQLTKLRWHHVVLTRAGARTAIWLDGKQVASGTAYAESGGQSWNAPLRLGAGGTEGRTDDLFDGDIAMPVLYSRALTATEIARRFAQRGLEPATGDGVLGCWPLTEERGDRIRDVSGNRRHGRIVNHATWMIGGPSFDPEVARFGDYDPATDPKRGHGLRFASDDLYDCGWDVTHRWRVPGDTKPGIHVGRLRFMEGDELHVQYVTFIVRRPRWRRKAPILVLCATNTWRAYSGTPFGKSSAKFHQVFGTGGTENSPGDPPAYNFYRNHAAGQGTYQMGTRLPWPAAGPHILYGGPTLYSHLMRAERFVHVWLAKEGYDFDVITDHDLHRDPNQLRGYDAFVINGHSEYWSFEMYRGLERHLARGGNAIVLSGNSLFWRVSFSDDGTVIECRKVDAPGEQVPAERRGESWHSHDGQRGGLTNECGMPGWKLIGLTTLGWNNQGNPKNFGPYVAELTDHFLFNEPEKVGLRPGDKFGWTGKDDVTPLANGHEFDVRLSTLAALQEKPSPPGQSVPADPAGMIRLANGIIPWKEGGAAFDYWFNPIKPKTDQGGEMIYWERPEGGRVFNAGSIGSGWALLEDKTLQKLLRNVLHHFGVARPKS